MRNGKLKVAFDVDGTLIDCEDRPRYDVIALFRLFDSLGCLMIIWSGDGIDYAWRWSQKLGLDADIFDKCSMDVDIAVDDMMESENWGKDFKAKVVIKV